jgi:hypothetical protein
VSEPKPDAYMRRWAFNKIDVMKMPKKDRPTGWQLHETSVAKILRDDVPLYATRPTEAKDD